MKSKVFLSVEAPASQKIKQHAGSVVVYFKTETSGEEQFATFDRVKSVDEKGSFLQVETLSGKIFCFATDTVDSFIIEEVEI